jgi:hypothetical protein
MTTKDTPNKDPKETPQPKEPKKEVSTHKETRNWDKKLDHEHDKDFGPKKDPSPTPGAGDK